MPTAWIDADILIWVLRGDRNASEFLVRLQRNPLLSLSTSVVQRGEVLSGMRPEEFERTHKLLDLLTAYPLTVAIVDMAAELFRRWHPSHNVSMNDAILAATASMHDDGTIYTQNVKHFPMPGLRVERGWEQ